MYRWRWKAARSGRYTKQVFRGRACSPDSRAPRDRQSQVLACAAGAVQTQKGSNLPSISAGRGATSRRKRYAAWTSWKLALEP